MTRNCPLVLAELDQGAIDIWGQWVSGSVVAVGGMEPSQGSGVPSLGPDSTAAQTCPWATAVTVEPVVAALGPTALDIQALMPLTRDTAPYVAVPGQQVGERTARDRELGPCTGTNGYLPHGGWWFWPVQPVPVDLHGVSPFVGSTQLPPCQPDRGVVELTQRTVAWRGCSLA